MGHAQARLLIVESSRIAANLTRRAEPEHPLPPIVVLRANDGECGATAATFLPATGDDMVVQDLPEDALAAPTAIFAVPRIFERFHARIEQALADAPLKRRLFAACVARGFRVATKSGTWLDHLIAPLLQRVVGAPVLAKLGGRLRLAVVGGAALDPELARTFIGLGLPMLQGYEMTEASPVIAVNRDDDNVPESVGPPSPLQPSTRWRRVLMVRSAVLACSA